MIDEELWALEEFIDFTRAGVSMLIIQDEVICVERNMVDEI
jgi:hypothetical protein